MCKYYFVSGNEENIYVLELNNSKREIFDCFYLEIMANKEEKFFENPTEMIKYTKNGEEFKSLSVEKCSKERIEELVDTYGSDTVFAYNNYGVYDFYGYDNCSLYRYAIATVLADPYYDFIGDTNILDFVQGL